MSLTPGARLGPYEIQSAIGAGGMGEVYKAKDTRLDRSVAIKVLPREVSADPDRRARFEREAKTIAGLSHPQICTLHDVGEHEGATFLVMEHLTGETLAQRLEKGPLPLDQALTIGTEIADALSAAHRQGVVHRDLKPGNVMLTKSGAKLLDFGLAKLKGHGEQAAAALLASVPTERTPLTGEGTIVGTLPYMAPEQVEGKPADARTDLWALGAMLYEMLTGKRAFEGTSAASLIGHIMNSEPPALATLQPLTPPAVDRVVRRCLAKDPDARWQTATDLADALRWMRETSGIAAPAGVVARRRRGLGTAVLGVALVVTALGVGRVVWRTPPAVPRVVQSVIPVSPAENVNTGSRLDMHPGGALTAIAWSPDGRTLAFIGMKGTVRQVYLRALDRDAARPLDGTEGARCLAFSPDGEWIAFWANGQVRKVRVAGGPPTKICDAGVALGIAWGPTRLVYAAGSQLLEVSSDGGAPRALVESTVLITTPHLLPGDTAVLYTEHAKTWTSGDERVMVLSLAPGGAPKTLLAEAADARYLPTGHLAFFRQGTVFVVPFNAKTLQVAAGATAVLTDVPQAVASWNSGDLTLAGQLAVSGQGTLAYVASPPLRFPDFEVVSVNRKGQVTALTTSPKGFREHVEPSPDGLRLAVSVQTTKSIRLHLFDTIRGTLDPVGGESADAEVIRPIWAKDGRLAFEVRQGRASHLAIGRPDVASPAEVIADSAGFVPSSWSPDGQHLLGTKALTDIWMYSPNATGPKFTPVVATPAVERWPAWSPDGQWLAYMSNVSERQEVYVQAYPGPGARIRVSTDGGLSPAWNPQGKELFYVEPVSSEEHRMMTVNMNAPLKPGRPVPLFSFSLTSLPLAPCTPTNCYAVAPNGAAFFGLRMVARTPSSVTHINLIQNWFEELKAKVPLK